jgi:hypothetical protein
METGTGFPEVGRADPQHDEKSRNQRSKKNRIDPDIFHAGQKEHGGKTDQGRNNGGYHKSIINGLNHPDKIKRSGFIYQNYENKMKKMISGKKSADNRPGRGKKKKKPESDYFRNTVSVPFQTVKSRNAGIQRQYGRTDSKNLKDFHNTTLSKKVNYPPRLRYTKPMRKDFLNRHLDMN